MSVRDEFHKYVTMGKTHSPKKGTQIFPALIEAVFEGQQGQLNAPVAYFFIIYNDIADCCQGKKLHK